MPHDVIQADYEVLAEIANRFEYAARANEQMRQTLQNAMAQLQQGGWIGRGSDAFFREMEDDVMPAVQRLIDALHEASRVTQQIRELLHQAEQEGASPIKDAIGGALGGSAGVGAGAGGGNDVGAGTGQEPGAHPGWEGGPADAGSPGFGPGDASGGTGDSAGGGTGGAGGSFPGAGGGAGGGFPGIGGLPGFDGPGAGLPGFGPGSNIPGFTPGGDFPGFGPGADIPGFDSGSHLPGFSGGGGGGGGGGAIPSFESPGESGHMGLMPGEFGGGSIGSGGGGGGTPSGANDMYVPQDWLSDVTGRIPFQSDLNDAGIPKNWLSDMEKSFGSIGDFPSRDLSGIESGLGSGGSGAPTGGGSGGAPTGGGPSGMGASPMSEMKSPMGERLDTTSPTEKGSTRNSSARMAYQSLGGSIGGGMGQASTGSSPMQRILRAAPQFTAGAAQNATGSSGLTLGLAAASPFVALLGKELLGKDDD